MKLLNLFHVTISPRGEILLAPIFVLIKLDVIFLILKVRPHYAARHTVAKCGKAARQKLRHATSICGRCVGLAVACRSMLRGLKI